MWNYIIEFFKQESLFNLPLGVLVGTILLLIIYVPVKLDEEGVIDLEDFFNSLHPMEIKKREVIASIAIIGIMLILGFMISGNIRESNLKRNEEYNQALKINNNTDMLEYGIETNIGNAFIYGDIIAVNPVIYKDTNYTSLTRVREKYTIHTRTVTTTDSEGHTHTRTETYWTWDEIDREKQHTNKLNIIGIEMPWEVLRRGEIPERYIETTDAGYNLRDVWYASNVKNTGTLYGNLGNIKNENGAKFNKFYPNEEINELVERLEKDYNIIWFWIAWSILGVFVVVGFYYADNKWLD